MQEPDPRHVRVVAAHLLEGNVTFQYDSRPTTKHLEALDVILHVYFERRPTP